MKRLNRKQVRRLVENALGSRTLNEAGGQDEHEIASAVEELAHRVTDHWMNEYYEDDPPKSAYGVDSWEKHVIATYDDLEAGVRNVIDKVRDQLHNEYYKYSGPFGEADDDDDAPKGISLGI